VLSARFEDFGYLAYSLAYACPRSPAWSPEAAFARV
jgi:hypothetical protein